MPLRRLDLLQRHIDADALELVDDERGEVEIDREAAGSHFAADENARLSGYGSAPASPGFRPTGDSAPTGATHPLPRARLPSARPGPSRAHHAHRPRRP